MEQIEYSNLLTIVVSILTSITTGGFVLVFVEIGNRKQRELDLHHQTMDPFMHKLTAYFKFMSWAQSKIIYPKGMSDYELKFKKLVQELGVYGGKAIMSGGDYPYNSFTAYELENINLNINNVWYYYDKMHPNNLRWKEDDFVDEFIVKELNKINPIYANMPQNANLVATVSGDFYTEVYQPIEYESYKHDAYQEAYSREIKFVSLCVGIVLMVFAILLFIKPSYWFLQASGLLVIFLIAISLLLLAIDIETQIKWHKNIIDLKAKVIKSVTFKKRCYRSR